MRGCFEGLLLAVIVLLLISITATVSAAPRGPYPGYGACVTITAGPTWYGPTPTRWGGSGSQ